MAKSTKVRTAKPAAVTTTLQAEAEIDADVGQPPVTATSTHPRGKLGALVALLKAPSGATIEAMVAATGWQVHSVRGAMSGALKKKLGLTILSEKTEAGRIYRIPADVGAEA